MLSIKLAIIDTLKDAVTWPTDRFVALFKAPDRADRGDLALPCFPFAKELKKKPQEIATEWASLFNDNPLFSSVNAEGPFLNFTYNGPELAKQIVSQVLEQGDSYGNGNEGEGKTVVLDYSSPNIAKPIAFHHIRSTVIGNAIANLHQARGWKAVRINYLGDWGTQFGKLIVAFRNWGSEAELKAKAIRHLLDIYVRFHKEVEDHPELEQEARDWFRKMEDGDKDALAYWQMFNVISMEEFKNIYGMLGISFDHFEGESFYRDRLDATVDLVAEKAGVQESEGALVVDLDDAKLPPCLLRKSDGATLYATRDIAAAIDRNERFAPQRLLYVVAIQQSVHFRQFFRVLEKMGYDWASNLTHVAFGMLQLADKTMSTRKGEVIFLEDVLNKSIDLSREAIEAKNPDLANRDEVAKMVGVGAIIFGDLVNRRTNDVVFEWERILNFQGETGVYAQYSYARARSILRKAGEFDRSLFDPNLLHRDEERILLKMIGQVPERILRACDDYDPSVLARHLIELCRAFNRLYTIEGYRFLDEDDATRATRMMMTEAMTTTVRRGLALLGVETPEEM